MKKIFLIPILFVFLLVGCKAPQKEKTGSSLRVVSSIAMIDDLVAKVGGDRISHETLIIGEIDPHSYELVKGDDEKIEGATIVFINGLYLEHGASLQYKLSSHPHVVALGNYLLETYPDLILFEKGQIDPHVWMDISLWSKVVDPIVEALCEKDPEGEIYYKERGESLKKEMLCVHYDLLANLQSIPFNKRYLITSHDAFSYFARAYLATKEEQIEGTWKNRVAAPEGLAPDGQLGTLALQEIMDHLIFNQIEVVFPESNVSRSSLRKIVLACQEKKIPIRFSQDTLYGDCMGPRGSLEGTYLGMLKHNGAVLLKEWQ